MVTVLCNDSEIEVEDGEVCEICGLELEEFDQVTGTGIHGYYHWTCVTHMDQEMASGGNLRNRIPLVYTEININVKVGVPKGERETYE